MALGKKIGRTQPSFLETTGQEVRTEPDRKSRKQESQLTAVREDEVPRDRVEKDQAYQAGRA